MPSWSTPFSRFTASGATPATLRGRATPWGRFTIACSLLVLSWVEPKGVSAATAVINAANVHQIIRGFGGATVFRPTDPLSPSDLNSLFGTGPNEIGLTLLRIRVAEDDAWRALELSNARGAIARGAAVIATPWSPPAAMKSNQSLIQGSLTPSAYTAYATYLNDFARIMAANGAPLYAISIQNEPDIEVTYESCDWTPAQLLEFCRSHAGVIDATRVIAPESFQFRRTLSDPLLNNPAAAANVDIIGGHIYGGGLFPYPLAATRGKEVWMTEHLDLSVDWTGALATAKEIHDCLAVANFSAYLWWYVKRYYGPLGEDGVVTKRGYVMSQFSRFIRPEAVRIGATENPSPGVYVSAYQRDKLVIVAVNLGTAAVSQTFSLQGTAPVSFTPWVTSATLSMAVQPAISLQGGTVTAALPAESVTTLVANLPIAAPSIVAAPRSHRLQAGSTVVLDVTATGDFVTYEWKRDGLVLPVATRQLTLSQVQAADAGTYTVTVRNGGGQATSVPATLTVVSTDSPGRLVNLSTRSSVDSGDGAQIAGFVIGGTSPKAALIRSAGPALGAASGLSGVLTDPNLELYDQGSRAKIATNDSWNSTLTPLFAKCGAFAWPAGSKDAALATTLAPGAYTAVVRGSEAGVGLALVEIYDVESADPASRLVNLSSRTVVKAGDAAQIAGFVVGGTTAKTVLLRASGPALGQIARLVGTLPDPSIELYDQATSSVLATNDDWNVVLSSHFARVGAFPWPLESKDAALVVTLDPGAYTVVVRGKSGGTGLALVEVYALP